MTREVFPPGHEDAFRPPPPGTSVYSIGHSVHPLPAFITLLEAFGIGLVADVRTIPRSRHNPQFNRDGLAADLKGQGIDYLWVQNLGGLRKPARESINTAWKNESFRGFADYMQTEAFAMGLEHLIEVSTAKATVLMCAEGLPWRCHRSLIADALYARGIVVRHIFPNESAREHRLTSFAVVRADRTVYYPG